MFGKSFTIIPEHRALLSIMKENRSNKSYNSRLTRWIDRLLPFDFNIEHIPCAKMGLVDYILRQPNQEAKVTNKYDEQFAVATFTRFRDAIAAIFVNTTSQNCQSQHFNSVTRTHSTRASHPRLTNYSTLLSALNRNTTQLLLENSANAAPFQSSSNNTVNLTSIPTHSEIPANASHIHTIPNHTMSNITSNPQTPSTHSRVTFQSTPNSAVNTTRSSTEGQNSPNLDLSKEEVFENNLTQLFTKGFLAVLTNKDAVLKEVRDCILQNDPQRCKEVNPYIFSYWRDLHVRSGCVCIDERVAIPHSIQDAVLESLHLTHPGSWGMITLGEYAFWPYMQREILNKAAQCKPCTDIGRSLKPVVPASKWKPLQTCKEPNEEIEIDFGGPITNEKDRDIYFLACIDRFSKFPTVEVFEKANEPNVLNFLDDYIHIHGVPRNIRLDQARCLIGNKVKTFCKQHNINILTAPVNDHRAIGLVERLIQTIKRRLSCMKLDNRNQSFTIKEAIKSIVYQLRICKQKTTNVTPFQAHFGRKPNTPLGNISTVPKFSYLSYEDLSYVVPASKWKPLQTCKEPNEEIEIDFGGPITNEKDQDIYFLACIDRFSKFPTVEVFEKANGPNVLIFLDDYIHIHGVPRNIRLDQARCLIGNKVKTFCKQHNINILTAPVNEHRAIGLVERLIKTIKRRLSCMKLDNRNQSFTIKEAIKSIVYQLRICKQKTTNVTPFQAHFGRKPNTPLGNISTVPKSSYLSYEDILHHYLDADTDPVEDYLDENGWVTGDRSDILIEEAMQKAQVDVGRCYNGDHNKSIFSFYCAS